MDHCLALAQLLGVGKVTSAYGKGVNNLTKKLSTIGTICSLTGPYILFTLIANPETVSFVDCHQGGLRESTHLVLSCSASI